MEILALSPNSFGLTDLNSVLLASHCQLKKCHSLLKFSSKAPREKYTVACHACTYLFDCHYLIILFSYLLLSFFLSSGCIYRFSLLLTFFFFFFFTRIVFILTSWKIFLNLMSLIDFYGSSKYSTLCLIVIYGRWSVLFHKKWMLHFNYVKTIFHFPNPCPHPSNSYASPVSISNNPYDRVQWLHNHLTLHSPRNVSLRPQAHDRAIHA